MAWPISSLFHERLVEFSSSTRMNACPAVFTVILQAGNIGTEEWSKFPTTASALAFITHLIIKHVWLHFHLHKAETHKVHTRSKRMLKSNQLQELPCFHALLANLSALGSLCLTLACKGQFWLAQEFHVLPKFRKLPAKIHLPS